MGLEANCRCQWDDGAADVHVLLEAHDLIVRGALRRRIPISEMKTVRVEGASLCFIHANTLYMLDLGAERAQRWAKKIATPPPSLAKKLGAGPNCKVWLVGSLEDPVLQDALDGFVADRPDAAVMSLAVVHAESDLTAALDQHRATPAAVPM